MVVRRFFIVLLLSMSFVPISAGAQSIPDSCDPGMLNLMEKNAWKSGQREVELAQRIILKPDSVLEYSCIQNQLSKHPQALTLGLDTWVQYVTTSFGATFAGVTYSGAGFSNCNQMNAVWNFLKCENIAIDDTDQRKNFFFTFADLESFDPRDKPLSCDSVARNEKWVNHNDDTDLSIKISD